MQKGGLKSEIMNEQTDYIIQAEKTLHKGQFFGNVSNGGGIIALSDGYSLKFVALNNDFVCVQLLNFGKGIKEKSQQWTKTKSVVKKQDKKKEIPKEEIKVIRNKPLEMF